jgi:hypothetical protein
MTQFRDGSDGAGVIQHHAESVPEGRSLGLSQAQYLRRLRRPVLHVRRKMRRMWLRLSNGFKRLTTTLCAKLTSSAVIQTSSNSIKLHHTSL